MWPFGKKWKCAVCGEMHPDQDKFCPKCGTPKRVYRDRYDVFISYRRDGGGDVAAVVQLELEKFGKSAFLDVLELQVGRFDEQILKVIETSDAFVLVLSHGCLDRCVNKTDWLKCEIMHALTLGKRIIPVHLPGFSFPNEKTLSLLLNEMCVLPNLQAVEWDTSKRDASMRKIVQAMVAPYTPPATPQTTQVISSPTPPKSQDAPDKNATGSVSLSQPIPARIQVSTPNATDGTNVIISEPSGIELVRIPGGEFLMGSPKNEEGRSNSEGPQHKVRVADFYLGRYPVTNEKYGQFLDANSHALKPRYWGDRQYNQPNQPVVGVRWYQARAYCEWAGLRLPSEAEWEYACRAETTTRFWSGNTAADLAMVGWYDGNSDRRLHAVGEKEPNPFGLFDMHGNVWEWVEDCWHDNYDGAPTDRNAWVDNQRAGGQVACGGAFCNHAELCRSAHRGYWNAGAHRYVLGFRPAWSIPAIDPAAIIADKSEGSHVSSQGPDLRSAIPEINGAPIVVTKKRITDTKTNELETLPTNPVPATSKPGISSARLKVDTTDKRHRLSSFVVSYDGDYLIGADNHGWVRKWLLPSQEIVAERQFPRAVQLNQDPFGTLIVASTEPDNLNQGDIFLISWNSLEPVARKAYQGGGPYWGRLLNVVFTSEQIIALTQRIEKNGQVMMVTDQLTVFDKATYKASRILLSSMDSRLLNTSPDGRRVAIGSGLSIDEWDILSGELIRKGNREEPTPKMEWKGMSHSIISPDWNYIVHGHTQGRIRTFRYDNLEMINTVTQPFNGQVVGFKLSISPSGHRCFWNDVLGWVRVFSLPEAKPIAAFEGLTKSISIYDCVFSPDSKLACVYPIAYPQQTVSESVSPRVINLDDGQLESQLHELNGGVRRAQFVGNTLYTLDGEGRLTGWNINNWSQVFSLERVGQIKALSVAPIKTSSV